MLVSTVTQKGQITIPADLREALKLQPGDKVSFTRKNNKILISKQKNDVTAAFGMLKVKRKVSLKAIQDAIEEGPLDDID